MCKRVMISLFTMSVVALVWTDANAGCSIILGKQVCTSKATGSGLPIDLVIVNATGDDGFEPDDNACSAVDECQGAGCEGGDGISILQATPVTSLNLRLVGTGGEDCGLGPDDNESCAIEGVALCEGSTNKKATTPGPLKVDSPGFAQTDFDTNSANFRYQLDAFQQEALCPGGTFEAFFPREGFFETCVNGDDFCAREFCKVDLGGIQRDVPRIYNCQPL